ncbi:MAG: signal peptidase II [Lachnospiraceae bacterium]|nr:signal peptidase II [Lachnospiraceae bacterium]
MKRKYLWIWIPVLILIDQLTKYWAQSWLSVNGPVELIPGVFELHFLTNRGSAWGMLEGQFGLFYVLTGIALILFVYVLLRIPEEKKYRKLQIITVFLISGALGNLIDRVIHQYVVDFLYISLIDFPIFNVADMYVTIPVVFLMLFVLTTYKDDEFAFLSLKKSSKDVEEEGANHDL